MDIAMLADFFMWCTILNTGLLALGFLITAFGLGSNFIYKLHNRWFPMPKESFNKAIYMLIGMYKIFILTFNVTPWIALIIIK